jgi:hypothetical protein
MGGSVSTVLEENSRRMVSVRAQKVLKADAECDCLRCSGKLSACASSGGSDPCAKYEPKYTGLEDVKKHPNVEAHLTRFHGILRRQLEFLAVTAAKAAPDAPEASAYLETLMAKESGNFDLRKFIVAGRVLTKGTPRPRQRALKKHFKAAYSLISFLYGGVDPSKTSKFFAASKDVTLTLDDVLECMTICSFTPASLYACMDAENLGFIGAEDIHRGIEHALGLSLRPGELKECCKRVGITEAVGAEAVGHGAFVSAVKVIMQAAHGRQTIARLARHEHKGDVKAPQKTARVAATAAFAACAFADGLAREAEERAWEVTLKQHEHCTANHEGELMYCRECKQHQFEMPPSPAGSAAAAPAGAAASLQLKLLRLEQEDGQQRRRQFCLHKDADRAFPMPRYAAGEKLLARYDGGNLRQEPFDKVPPRLDEFDHDDETVRVYTMYSVLCTRYTSYSVLAILHTLYSLYTTLCTHYIHHTLYSLYTIHYTQVLYLVLRLVEEQGLTPKTLWQLLDRQKKGLGDLRQLKVQHGRQARPREGQWTSTWMSREELHEGLERYDNRYQPNICRPNISNCTKGKSGTIIA